MFFGSMVISMQLKEVAERCSGAEVAAATHSRRCTRPSRKPAIKAASVSSSWPAALNCCRISSTTCWNVGRRDLGNCRPTSRMAGLPGCGQLGPVLAPVVGAQLFTETGDAEPLLDQDGPARRHGPLSGFPFVHGWRLDASYGSQTRQPLS